MVSVSLLQRLEDGEASVSTAAGEPNEAAVMDSVLANLQVILNSRQGCCETRDDFGLTDFNGVSENFRSSIALIARDVERQIRQFEPRLRNVFVRTIEDKTRPLDLVFHIDGELNHKDRIVRVAIDSVLGTDGQIRVSG